MQINRQSGMIKCRRQMLSPAAAPHIEAQNIEPGAKRFLRRAEHIMRLGRAFEAVNDDDRWAGLFARLPMTVSDEADLRLGGKLARLARKLENLETARP